ncbi:cactin-like isoform X1 [Hibiscus syriacus]|uniref:Cactin-like isoform X1 n=1 Tax=Hibiscus syriacus TaxID=106335 RepID=A0A6A3CIH8_HIBSY|nr:NDR1/HIN1-like protein 6 [Hibiscus syriacus]KAE8728517.1 cactin-like isoform X1 [Hibiscus syriacus]
MADQQRIHPVSDIESPPQASPTAPLVPVGSTKSDHVNPVQQHQPDNSHGTAPVNHTRTPKKRRSCWCRCLCWTLSIILLLIVIIGIIVGILFLVFRPKLPDYSIDGLEVTRFNLSSNSSLSAGFDVNITARNPNRRIGIYYEGGSRITVWYNETQLVQGSIPKFYQGHRNTTVLVVPMSGQIQNGTNLLASLQQQQLQTGNIPLLLRARQPVRVKLGSLKLPEMKFTVRCRLVVDALSANNAIRISRSSCRFRFRL